MTTAVATAARPTASIKTLADAKKSLIRRILSDSTGTFILQVLAYTAAFQSSVKGSPLKQQAAADYRHWLRHDSGLLAEAQASAALRVHPAQTSGWWQVLGAELTHLAQAKHLSQGWKL